MPMHNALAHTRVPANEAMTSANPLHALNAQQQALVQRLTTALGNEPGVAAVALGGSYARGHATPESDIDLALYYSEAAPPDLVRLTQLVNELHPEHSPASAAPDFTAIGEWGPWVNGGAWLRFGGQRVDVLYRSLDQVRRVLTDCAEGRWELHWAQQPPFGYFSPAFIEELCIGVPLFDRTRGFTHLRSIARVYPGALRQRIVQEFLWSAEFNLAAFAPKFVRDGNVFGLAGCTSRIAFQLVQVLFALNMRWPVPDRVALAATCTMQNVPERFSQRLAQVLGEVGTTSEAQRRTLGELMTLWQEVRALAGPMYAPRQLPEKVVEPSN